MSDPVPPPSSPARPDLTQPIVAPPAATVPGSPPWVAVPNVYPSPFVPL